MRPTIMTLAATVLLAGPVAAQSQMPGLDRIGFMAGCWEGPFESRGRTGVIQEQYTAPSRNVMLGTTRYLIGDLVVQFEFTSLLGDSSGVVLTPYPRGSRSEHGFRLTHAQADSAVFAAPEHDFPKRIVYRLRGGKLIARIDDGNDAGQAMVWEMERSTRC